MKLELGRLQDKIREESLKARGKSIQRRKSKDTSRPASRWIAPAKIGNKTGNALSIVLATPGCSHAQDGSGGCTMCSYLLDGVPISVTSDDLVSQFQYAMSSLDESEPPISVKIYTSGSFLDPAEVSDVARNEILGLLSDDSRVTEVVLESRPEFVNDEVMSEVISHLGKRHVEIGIGIESTNDIIREICINKGFSLADFEGALETARSYGIGVRSYVLLKPPLITERDALIDTTQSILQLAEVGVSTVSINPVNVQKFTFVERLWRRGHYRPPWLWTLIEVLKETRHSIDQSINILCDPVAAGKRRGIHNCGDCDKEIVSAIRAFSLDQDISVFDGIECDCELLWKHVLEHEDSSLLVHV